MFLHVGVIFSTVAYYFSSLQRLLLGYYLSCEYPADKNLPILEDVIASLHKLDLESPLEPVQLSTPAEGDGDQSALSTPATSPILQYQQEQAPFPTPQTCETPWWEYINERCQTSICLRSYLHIALACRSICIKEVQALPTEEVRLVYTIKYFIGLHIKLLCFG